MQKIKALVAVPILFLLLFFFAFFLLHPNKLNSASLTTASATMSNSRLSYRAGVGVGISAGATTITIDTSDNADNNNFHLFPKDTVCFPDSGENGCKNQTTYTVSNIIDDVTDNKFTITPGLAGALVDTDLVIATQSGSLIITFTTVNEIPSDGDILITIPAVNTDNKTCDGIPDTGSSVSANGFDLSTVAAADISVTGCTDENWVATETITCGSSTADHTIRIDRQTSSCAASTTVTVTIDSSPGVINPAPITTDHTQGRADVYTINATTRDASDSTLDTIDVKVAPVEAVLVSATVDETLSFQVQSVATGATACGQAVDVTTTAYSVPWGTLDTANVFKEAGQQLTVSTNADAGYTVKIEENDQMGKNGDTCSGADAGEADNCIQDTTCSASGPCTESAGYGWTDDDAYHGLGYSLENVGADTDAVFVYNSNDPCSNTVGDGTFCAKQFADQEPTPAETKATIMCGGGGNCASNGPVSSKDVYVCYRIAISATQPAGYYYNKVKYTATATF